MTETAIPTAGIDAINKWTEETLIPAQEGKPTAGNLVLLSADVDRIKEYVFESNRLPEIRGGSITLDRLNRDWPTDEGANLRRLFERMGLPVGKQDDDAAPSCIVYAAGGSLLALVPERLDGVKVAETLQERIEALYPNETDTATITCVWQPVNDQSALSHSFRRLMDAQTLRLRRRKDQREHIPFVEALPHQRRCESCGARPAVRFRPGPPERWLCAACDKKAAQGSKGFWANQFVKHLEDKQLDVDPTAYLGDAPRLTAVHPALDLGEIAASGDGHTIGFIYADGDGMGRFIESSASLQEYHEKSDALTKLLPNLVYTALARHLCVHSIEHKDKGRVFIHPFEIITIGGDDLLLIVPGNVVLPIALQIGSRFAEEIENQLGEWEAKFGWKRPNVPLTMSAGVVIADHHNPIRFVHKLADQLLKNAKKQARESKGGEGNADGAIDFVVLKSQSMLAIDLSDLRRRIYQFSPQPREQLLLTGRPYLWRDMRKLLDHARLLRDTSYPRTQMQALRRVLREGQRWGRLWPSLWYIRQQMRASQTRRAVMRRIDREWSASAPKNSSAPPWSRLPPKKNVDRYMTIWEDLHEVRELLPKLRQEPEDIQQQARLLMQEVLGRAEQEEAYES